MTAGDIYLDNLKNFGPIATSVLAIGYIVFEKLWKMKEEKDATEAEKDKKEFELGVNKVSSYDALSLKILNNLLEEMPKVSKILDGVLDKVAELDSSIKYNTGSIKTLFAGNQALIQVIEGTNSNMSSISKKIDQMDVATKKSREKASEAYKDVIERMENMPEKLKLEFSNGRVLSN